MNEQAPGGQRKRVRSIVVAGNKTMDVLSLSLLLQRLNYDVFTSHSVVGALELVAAKRPVLVITDVILPGMSGFDLLRLLRQDNRAVTVPVVFLVPMTDAAAERRCLDMGAAGCITRPILAEQIYRVVQEVTEPMPRSDIRIDTRLPVSLNNVPLDCGQQGCDVDLSEHGMYVRTNNPYPRNRRVSVVLLIKDRRISAEGTVMHSHASGMSENREPGMGLKFVKIDPRDSDFIRKYIRDELARDVRAALSHGDTDTR